jgi:hypothetical protein
VRLGILIVAALTAWSSGSAPPLDASDGAVQLFADDFSCFPPGVLSAPLGQLNGAIQEYHYIEHRGVPRHPWRNPIVHLDSWAAGGEAEDDGPYPEQHTVNDDVRMTPLFVTGDPAWRDYRVEVSLPGWRQ